MPLVAWVVPDSPFNYTFAQAMVFVFLLLTTVVGAWKAQVTGSFNVALAWNGLNTIVLGIFLTVTYREARTARAARRAARQEARRKARARRRRHAPHPSTSRPTRPRPSLEAPDELSAPVSSTSIGILARGRRRRRAGAEHEPPHQHRPRRQAQPCAPTTTPSARRTPAPSSRARSTSATRSARATRCSSSGAPSWPVRSRRTRSSREKSPYDIRGGSKVVIRATSAGKVSEVQPHRGRLRGRQLDASPRCRSIGTQLCAGRLPAHAEAVRADARCRRRDRAPAGRAVGAGRDRPHRRPHRR